MLLQQTIRKKSQQEKEQLDQWVIAHNAKAAFPEGVQEIRDIPYLPDQQPCHLMDIYCPVKAGAALPVIINVHGGGLLMGSKEANRLLSAQLCSMGFLVFCVEYPLVPDKQVYQLFSDINAAMDKANELLVAYGGDREHVYLVGDSAGAYLITYIAAMQNCAKAAQAAGITPSGLPVKALGLICGMFYTRKMDAIGILLTEWIYGKGWRKHPFRPYFNPEHPDIVRNLPPCFLITAGGDNLRHYTLQFYKALTQNGVTCRLKDYPDKKQLEHAFSAIRPELAESQEANREMAEFLLQF